MICPNCDKNGAKIDPWILEIRGVIRWTCSKCGGYDDFGAKEVNAWSRRIRRLERKVNALPQVRK